MKTISIKEPLSAGWKAFTANLPVFLIWGALMVGVWAFQQLGVAAAGAGSGAARAVFLSLVTVIARVAQIWLNLALIRMALKLVDGQAISAKEIFRGPAPDFVSFLVATVLFAVMVGFGLALLIVPGIYLAVRYGAYGFVVAADHPDPITAFKRSAALTEGVRWELLAFGLAMIGVNIVGAIALGVGLIATIPITVVASARIYRQLVARATARAEARARIVTPPVTVDRPAEVH